MKHSFLMMLSLSIQLCFGCNGEEPSSRLNDGSNGSASLGFTIDTSGDWSFGGSSGRDSRKEMTLSSGRSSSSSTDNERTYSSSKEKINDSDYDTEITEKDCLVREAGNDRYQNRNDIPAIRGVTHIDIANERYRTLQEAEQSFDRQMQQAADRITQTWRTSQPFLEQLKPMLSTAAFAHNDDIHRTLALTSDAVTTAKAYAGSFKTNPMTTAGSRLIQASKELKYAWKELPNRFTGSQLAQRSAVLKAAGSAIDVADVMFSKGDQETGDYMLKIGLTLVDAALGFVPIVGWVKDIQEATTGYNILLDRPLTDAERAFAVVGAVTGGLGSQVIATGKALKAIDTFFKSSNAGDAALRAVIRASQMLGH